MNKQKPSIMHRQALILAALIVTSHSVYAANDTIRIGVSCPMTGGSADMGLSVRNGIRLAVDEINSWAGGVVGKKIELVERDDQGNPEVGKKIAEELVGKEKVSATIGACNTGVGMAMLETYQDARVPLIIPVATGTPLTKKFAAAGEHYIFRVSPRDEVQAPFIVAEVMKRGFRKIALFADTTGYGEAGKNDVEKALAAQNITPVSVQRFALGVKDLSEQVNLAKAAGADVVVSYTVGPEAAVLAKSIAKQKWGFKSLAAGHFPGVTISTRPVMPPRARWLRYPLFSKPASSDVTPSFQPTSKNTIARLFRRRWLQLKVTMR